MSQCCYIVKFDNHLLDRKYIDINLSKGRTVQGEKTIEAVKCEGRGELGISFVVVHWHNTRSINHSLSFWATDLEMRRNWMSKLRISQLNPRYSFCRQTTILWKINKRRRRFTDSWVNQVVYVKLSKIFVTLITYLNLTVSF